MQPDAIPDSTTYPSISKSTKIKMFITRDRHESQKSIFLFFSSIKRKREISTADVGSNFSRPLWRHLAYVATIHCPNKLTQI